MNDLKLAEYMHNKYEEIAAGKNWKTQKKCRVPFSKLPKENQETMLGLARDLNQKFNAQEMLMCQTVADQANKITEQAKTIELMLSIMPRKFLIKAMAELHDRRARERFG